ncbi:MAG: metallophosphoesterase family protein, partial [Candidatus Hodarchaeota archaeon]
ILDQTEYDAIIFLGDIVSYGPDPHLCVDLLKNEKCIVSVMGNHDYATVNIGEDCRTKWPYKPLSIVTREHARRVLDDKQMDWLSKLKQVASFSIENCTFYAVHGSPTDPLFGELSVHDSDSQLFAHVSHVNEQYILCAHTHIPFIRVLPTGATIINPGAVGQPRDGNRHASCALIDLSRSYNQILRFRYDISKTVRRIQEAGLPSEAGEMLLRGGY